MRRRCRLARANGRAPTPDLLALLASRPLPNGERRINSRPRDASSRPSSFTAAFETVTRRFHSALHAKLQQTNAGGSIGKRRFGTDDKGKNERKNRKQNADRGKSVFCRALRARPRLDRQAHIYRRSTAVLAPRSLSSQGTQPQATLPGTWRGHVLRIPLTGRYPPLPVPVQRRTSHPSRSARGLMPKAARAGLQARPRDPHSPARSGTASQTASGTGRDR